MSYCTPCVSLSAIPKSSFTSSSYYEGRDNISYMITLSLAVVIGGACGVDFGSSHAIIRVS
jgi:hypothetical protein